MGNASLNISVVDKRMFSATEAADYTGIPRKHFKNTCPVQPVELRPGAKLYDKRDLDVWIDGIKTGTELATQDAILDKL
ncbi:hypothetical protein [Halovulum sp. GXIMD14793]